MDFLTLAVTYTREKDSAFYIGKLAGLSDRQILENLRDDYITIAAREYALAQHYATEGDKVECNLLLDLHSQDCEKAKFAIDALEKLAS